MFRLPTGAIDVLHSAKTGYGAHGAPYSLGIGVTDPVPSAEVKNGWNYTSAVWYTFMEYTGTTLISETRFVQTAALLVLSCGP